MVKKMPEILVHFLDDCLLGDESFTYKTMFGGYAIYKYGRVFSLFILGQIYFKVDDKNRYFFEEAGSKPFKYKKKGGEIGVMSYYELPEEVLEDRDELEVWIERSLQVESKTKKKTKKNIELDKKILEYLLEIPKGKVSTYKRIGDRFGVHSRKVASVMKYNKNPDIYPCYKVISESGKLSGYSALDGVSSKVEKLEKDGVRIVDGVIGEEYIV